MLLSGGSAVIIKTAEVCFSYSMEKEEWIWKAEGRAESILEQLEEIGKVPEALGKEILEERDLDTLKRWAKLTLRCGSVEDFLLQYREEPQGKTQGKG